jgi:hypothetical protein
MGIEYRLRFNAPDDGAVDAVLRQLPTARAAKAPGVGYDLGDVTSDEAWPEATVSVEPGGAYYCDHCGGSGRALLGQVVASLVSVFGTVTIEEL